MTLYVEDTHGDTIEVMPCAIGKNWGDKKKTGDKKTPEGTFKVVKIQDSRKWTHDFKDGYGERKGAYGTWFFRLKVPGFTGIGIHGTCFPESIGKRSSEGCIRLSNSDIIKLKKYVSVGMLCIIEKDY